MATHTANSLGVIALKLFCLSELSSTGTLSLLMRVADGFPPSAVCGLAVL